MEPKRPRHLLSLALLVLGLGGCSTPEPPAAPSRTVVRIGVHSLPLSLDPHARNEVLSFRVLFNIYDRLVRFESALRATPALAQSWENPNDRTWLFHLWSGPRFHDGRPVTAEDVAASIRRAQGPGSEMGAFLADVESARALDLETVEIRTRDPAPTLLNKLAFIAILPADAPAQIDHPIGSGPYRFAGISDGVLRLERAPESWHEEPGPSRAEFVSLPDPEDRVDALLEQRVDLIHEVSPKLYDLAIRDPTIRGAAKGSLQVSFLHLSPRHPLFRDPRVRHAVDHAIDRDALVEKMLGGHGIPASQLVSPLAFGFDPDLRPTRHEPELARRLLAEAGYPDGVDLELEYRDSRDASPIRDQLSEAGIRVRLSPMSWAEVYPRLTSGRIPFYYGGLVSTSGDASDVLDGFAHSRIEGKGRGAGNYIGYSNLELDTLIQQASTRLDNLSRRKLLHRCLKMLQEDAVYLPLFVPDELFLMREDLVWEPRADGVLWVAGTSWKTHH